jgi:hypothetical protein
LGTSPATYGLLAESRLLEVIPQSDVDSSFVFGDREGVRFLHVGPPFGAYGIVSDKWWNASLLPRAVARESEGGFVVSRATVSYDAGPFAPFSRPLGRLRIATERVGVDGSYSVEFGPDLPLPAGLSVRDVWVPTTM